jgi:hypothetical protein
MSYSDFSLFQQLNLLSDSRDTTKFSDTAIIVRRGNLASIARRIGALSTSTTNPPSRDAFPSAQLKRLGADVPPARPPARIRVKRPHDPLLGARAARRCSVGLHPGRRQACHCGPRRRRRGRGRCTRCPRLRQLRLRRSCGCGRWVVELGRHRGRCAWQSGSRCGRRYRPGFGGGGVSGTWIESYATFLRHARHGAGDESLPTAQRGAAMCWESWGGKSCCAAAACTTTWARRAKCVHHGLESITAEARPTTVRSKVRECVICGCNLS